MKYVTFASLVAIIASAIASGASPQGSDPPTVFLAVFVGGLVGWFFSAMTWIYKSWEFLPYHSRRTASGRAISPGDAVFFQFIPLYNLYWLFVQNLGYCEALDGVLAQGGHRVRAPRSLAIVCCVVWMIPYLNWVLGPFLWMAYMIVTDNAKAQLLTTRAP